MNSKYILLTLIVTVILFTILHLSDAQRDTARGVRASDSKHHKNATKSGTKTTIKPGAATTAKGGKGTTRKFGASNRPRAPITGKPVDNTAKPKPKTLSPLLAPRNPKHTTTTTQSPEVEEYEDEEEERK